MSVNSSVSSLHPLLSDCFDSKTSVSIYASFVLANILLLYPLLFVILYLGLQQWQKQRSSSDPKTVSHSDFFTYNVIALEIISLWGASILCVAAYIEDQKLKVVGLFICSVTSPGQTLFHLLTSVERYLAVVHPISYRGLRNTGGIRIRNICTGFVWLFCFGWMCLSLVIGGTFSSITISVLLVFSLTVVSTSGYLILRVLKNPRPGAVSGVQGRVDQAKRRAFHTVVAIILALLMRFFGVLICNIMFTPPALTPIKCAVGSFVIWLTLPCSLVLPLLFLQRAGKLPACKPNAKSGQG